MLAIEQYLRRTCIFDLVVFNVIFPSFSARVLVIIWGISSLVEFQLILESFSAIISK